jgi:hypothetical protein
MICCVIVSRYHAFFAAGAWFDEGFAIGNVIISTQETASSRLTDFPGEDRS